MEGLRPGWLFEVASAFQRSALAPPQLCVETILSQLRLAVPPPSSPLEQMILDGFLARARNGIRTIDVDVRSRADTLEDRALRFLQHHYAEHLTYPVIGRELGCDPEYLEVLFRNRTGQSIHTYLRCYRVSKALQAIRRGEKVEAAALQCGFGSKSGFIRACRVVTGASPSQWR